VQKVDIVTLYAEEISGTFVHHS